MTIHKPYCYSVYIGLGLVLITIAACSSSSKAFRTHYSEGYQFRGYEATNTVTTGIACAAQPREAVEAAQQAAQFNLRSVVGSERFLVQYRETRRFQEDNQVCVEVIAIAREPE